MIESKTRKKQTIFVFSVSLFCVFVFVVRYSLSLLDILFASRSCCSIFSVLFTPVVPYSVCLPRSLFEYFVRFSLSQPLAQHCTLFNRERESAPRYFVSIFHVAFRADKCPWVCMHFRNRFRWNWVNRNMPSILRLDRFRFEPSQSDSPDRILRPQIITVIITHKNHMQIEKLSIIFSMFMLVRCCLSRCSNCSCNLISAN